MKIFRIRNKATGEFWEDSRQLNRIVKRLYYTLGHARGAIKSSVRMNKKTSVNIKTGQQVTIQTCVGDYEIVEYDLQEVAKYEVIDVG